MNFTKSMLMCGIVVMVGFSYTAVADGERERAELWELPFHAVTGDYKELNLSRSQAEQIKKIQSVERSRVRLIQQEMRGRILATLSDSQKQKLAQIEAEREERRRAYLQKKYEEAQAGKKTYDGWPLLKPFAGLSQGMTESEVIRKKGQPISQTNYRDGKESWAYSNRSRDGVTSVTFNPEGKLVAWAGPGPDRLKAEAERKRKAEEARKRKLEEDRKRKAEEERRRKEAEAKAKEADIKPVPVEVKTYEGYPIQEPYGQLRQGLSEHDVLKIKGQPTGREDYRNGVEVWLYPANVRDGVTRVTFSPNNKLVKWEGPGPDRAKAERERREKERLERLKKEAEEQARKEAKERAKTEREKKAVDLLDDLFR